MRRKTEKENKRDADIGQKLRMFGARSRYTQETAERLKDHPYFK